MSALSGFHHVKLPVSDVARSRDWYRRVLGLEVVIEFVEDDVLIGSRTGGRRREPVDRAAPGPSTGGTLSGFDAMALRVPSRAEVKQWCARLDDLDEAYGGVVTGHKGGSVLVGLHDPDGIEIRLYAD